MINPTYQLSIYPDQFKERLVLVLKIVCFFLFVGRAWQHLIWDAPYRTLLWNQELLGNVIPWLTGMTWEEYAGSTTVDNTIQLMIRFSGVVYLLSSLAVLFIHKNRLWLKYILYPATALLTLLAVLYSMEKFYHIGQLMEYSSQVIAPVLLIAAIKGHIALDRLIFYIKVAIALTFFGHGLYAIGYYPRPGVFVDLVINTFGFSEPVAHQIIFAAGLLDFAVVVFIFIPSTAFIALYYAAFWGVLTALSRYVANFDTVFFWQTTNQYMYEVLYRLPHAGLPIVGILATSAARKSRPIELVL